MLNLKLCFGKLSKAFLSFLSYLSFAKWRCSSHRHSLNEHSSSDSGNVDFDSLSESRRILLQLEEFMESKVVDLMIPRADIILISSDTSEKELHEVFVQKKLTRIPVYQNDQDNIIGFIHVKDFLIHISKVTEKYENVFDIKKIIRPVIYVPRSTRSMHLLIKMKTEGKYIAVVLDEYGGVDGIVTIAYLIEGIVGNIHDEHDINISKEERISKLEDRVYVIDSQVTIQEIEKEIGNVDFLYEEDGEYETLAGFILSYLGYMPKQNQKILHDSGLQLEIYSVTERKIGKVKFILPKANSDEK